MELPLKVGTLLYFSDDHGRILLMRRNREPNSGLWSPPGGKVHTSIGESPFACAIREAAEETGLQLTLDEVELMGFISEQAYEQTAHWHIFLFRITRKIACLPDPHPEGEFRLFSPSEIMGLDIPATDREFIWPMILDGNREGRFFSAHCECGPDDSLKWTLEQS